MYLAKPLAFLLAYTLGRISPNNKTTVVMTPTSSKNRSHCCSIASKNKEVSEAKTSTVAILIRLLSNNMMANNRLGFLRKWATMRSDLLVALTASLMYDGDSEKKATSDPETNAEPSNRHNNKITFNVSSVSKLKTK